MSGARKNCKYVGNIRDLKKQHTSDTSTRSTSKCQPWIISDALWFARRWNESMISTTFDKEANDWGENAYFDLLRSSRTRTCTNAKLKEAVQKHWCSELVGAFRATVMLWTVNRTTQKSLKAFPWNKYNSVIFGEWWTNTSSKEWWIA